MSGIFDFNGLHCFLVKLVERRRRRRRRRRLAGDEGDHDD